MISRASCLWVFVLGSALSGCAAAVYANGAELVPVQIESPHRRALVLVRDAQGTQRCVVPCGVAVVPGGVALSTEWSPHATSVVVPAMPTHIAVESRDGVAVAGLFTLLAAGVTLLGAGGTFGASISASYATPTSPGPALVTATEVLGISGLSLLAIGLAVLGFSAPRANASLVPEGHVIEVQPRVLIQPTVTESAMGVGVRVTM